LSWLWPALAAADSFRVENFAIHGATAQDLRADLSRLGPVGDTGIRGDAYTEYRIAWKFSMTLKGRSCRADNAAVELDVTMRLPSWVPPEGVDAQLIATWDRFSEVLREHEDGHHRLAIAAAAEVRRRLRGRVGAASCLALRKKLDDTVNQVLRDYREKQQDYDRDTDYGRAQGTNIL
jgi:predicted secreted Zn-dependent protease